MPGIVLDYEVPQLLFDALRASNIQDIILRNVEPVVESGFEELERRAEMLAPFGATGDLKEGIGTEVTRGAPTEPFAIRGELFSLAEHSTFVEEGTSPHFPPVDALRPWALRVLGDEGAAWAVAIAISQRGTRPQRFLRRTVEELMPFIEREVFEAVRQAIGDIRDEVNT